MTAFCRYLQPDGRIRTALFRAPTDSVAAQVCPLGDLLGDDIEESLAATHSLFQWSLEQLNAIAIPKPSQWLDAPAQLLPPVHQPEKIICIGLNYLDHAIETGAEPPNQPVVFSKFNNSLIGHGEAIVLPSLSKKVDYEAELVVVIGRVARHVTKADAMNHVFGYTAGHDVSARDWQKGRPGGQWLLGKSFDTFAPLGPAIVTRETFGDSADVSVQMYLGDERVQSSTTAQLIFDIPTLIAHLSGIMTLRPGDLIFTGTPPGVGDARTPPRYLHHGDTCTVEIPGIGRLTNICRDEKS